MSKINLEYLKELLKKLLELQDFLGYKKIDKGILKFNEVKNIIKKRKLNFKSARDYVDNFKFYMKKFKLKGFPVRPDRTFEKEWKGWPDFLGKK